MKTFTSQPLPHLNFLNAYKARMEMAQDILIKPPQLRSMAQILNERSQHIRAALEAVDKTINGLIEIRFSGQRAVTLTSRYQKQRSVIFNSPKIVASFAASLERAAMVFEKADAVSNTSVTSYIKGENDSSAIYPDDVMQGSLGDCYLISSIASISMQNPDFIKKMIRENDDGSYTVTLYKKKNNIFGESFEKTEVTVLADFPMNSAVPVYAKFGDSADGKSEIWPALIEKAYAQINGGYEKIGQGGFPHDALETLTGIKSKNYLPEKISINQLADLNQNASAVTLTSLPDYTIKFNGITILPDPGDNNPYYKNDTLVESHAYYVSDVNIEKGIVIIQNPWGWVSEGIEIPFKDFQHLFTTVSTNPVET